MVIKITYRAKDGNARVLLNHTLYGRLVYKNYRGRKHAYYVQGLLDNVKFIRKDSGGECLVFGTTNTSTLQDVLNIFGTIEIKEANFVEDELNELEQQSHTGAEYWKQKAEEKELPLRTRQRVKR